jgi:hypothetical protein
LARCTWRGLDHFKSYVWVFGRGLQPRPPHAPQTDLMPTRIASQPASRRRNAVRANTQATTVLTKTSGPDPGKPSKMTST